jgi:2-C-methyl-D-erythritol 4-phosphate cytidylyltransferase/2-C-methyl-D-erythritol 2,4-cyclodiphosphate synthase
MYVTAIIAAGGRGQRFGSALPKQFLVVGGRSVLERSVTLFATHPEIDEVIVALPGDLVEDPPGYVRDATTSAAPGHRPILVVPGGPRRQDSVMNAFSAASARSEMFVIHDAARPFVSADLVSRTIAAAVESGAAIAALVARDTVKRSAGAHGGPAEAGPHGSEAQNVGSGFSRTFVAETLPRASIFLAQTPQVFRRHVLRDAIAQAETGVDATDEAALAERAGHAVRIVEGEPANMKITTPEDLVLAEAIAASAAPGSVESGGGVRAGTGYDLHRLVEGRPLISGGVAIPSDRGALGHSDADVVCHAVTDAILGAGSLGDIGRHFPDTDARWKGASSLDLLARAVALVREQGFAIMNVDVTVILERPKIKDHIEAMRAAVAGAIGIGPDRVSIKGKTNEGVDATGRGEAIAAHAIALVTRP